MMSAGAIEWPWLDRVPGAVPRHLGGRAVVGGRGMVVAPQPLAAEAGWRCFAPAATPSTPPSPRARC